MILFCELVILIDKDVFGQASVRAQHLVKILEEMVLASRVTFPRCRAVKSSLKGYLLGLQYLQDHVLAFSQLFKIIAEGGLELTEIFLQLLGQIAICSFAPNVAHLGQLSIGRLYALDKLVHRFNRVLFDLGFGGAHVHVIDQIDLAGRLSQVAIS